MRPSRLDSALTSIISGAGAAILPQLVGALNPKITITTQDKWEAALFGAILGAVVEGLHITLTVRRDRNDIGKTYHR